ncbi:hypothetical protein LTR66_011048 [Elasticomyces elasticus]|nr:hypothetical protein LTR66_011048 [Elasticomyces elasticus]
MERIKAVFQRRQSYEPLNGGSERPDGEPIRAQEKHGFDWVEYAIFFLLGISMLWAWNMFLAAGPYFQHRFESNDWVNRNFQAAELSVSTVANLGSMLVLTQLQANASYPKRITVSLIINMVTFTLLALSTRFFLGVTAAGYFGFLITMVFATSLATGLCQNGIFAYVSGFGQRKYTQGIMTGQAVAVSPSEHGGRRLSPHQDGPPAPDVPSPVRSTAAFLYFLTATGISILTLVSFAYLASRHRSRTDTKVAVDERSAAEDLPTPEHKSIPLLRLLRKLSWLACAVFLTFAVTMVFPVFTQRIVSVSDPSDAPTILQPATFIPLAFLVWNIGDLLGRLLTAVPALSLTSYPRLVFILAALRVVFIPLYHLCNIGGKGAVVKSDWFYLIIVQLLFGFTNGFLGSTCMMGAGEWVDEGEREAAGGFMGLCLVAGLTAGSLASFFVAGG